MKIFVAGKMRLSAHSKKVIAIAEKVTNAAERLQICESALAVQQKGISKALDDVIDADGALKEALNTLRDVSYSWQ